jgi:hypothetical protein
MIPSFNIPRRGALISEFQSYSGALQKSGGRGEITEFSFRKTHRR